MLELNEILELMDDAYLNQDKDALEEAKAAVSELYERYCGDDEISAMIAAEDADGEPAFEDPELDPRDYV